MQFFFLNDNALLVLLLFISFRKCVIDYVWLIAQRKGKGRCGLDEWKLVIATFLIVIGQINVIKNDGFRDFDWKMLNQK